MKAYKFPRKHAQDWFSRCAGEKSEIISVTERTITLSLTDEDLKDLVSDATYYAEEMSPDNTGDIDYRPAARTLIKRLEKLGIVPETA